MRRWVKKLAVCVALGVVTTVVVAWVCWLNGLRPGTLGLPIQRLRIEQARTPSFAYGVVVATPGYREFTLIGIAVNVNLVGPTTGTMPHEPGWVRGWLTPTPLPDESVYPANAETASAAGWPALCLGAVWEYKVQHWSECVPCIQLWSPDSLRLRPPMQRLGLPLRPIVLGFVINTAFYGALWGALLVVTPAVRRLLRQRRGRCPACGYDLRGLSAARCPECGGATIPSSSCQTPPSQPA